MEHKSTKATGLELGCEIKGHAYRDQFIWKSRDEWHWAPVNRDADGTIVVPTSTWLGTGLAHAGDPNGYRVERCRALKDVKRYIDRELDS